MKTNTLLAITAALVTTGVFVAVSFAGDPAAEAKGGTDMEAMMAEYMKFAQPGEHHQHLDVMTGEWELAGRYRHEADMPWEESLSRCSTEWILGGRFLMSDVVGDATETMPAFEGVGILGYDVYKKNYTSIWIDNFGTTTFISDGACDGSGKVITLTGTHDDPVSGETKTSKSVYTIKGADEYVLDMYRLEPDGSELHVMSITHTRTADSASGE